MLILLVEGVLLLSCFPLVLVFMKLASQRTCLSNTHILMSFREC